MNNTQGKEETWNDYRYIDFVNCTCPIYDAAFLDWVDTIVDLDGVLIEPNKTIYSPLV